MPFESPLCVIIGLDKKLFDYYWINILDEDIRFAAVIEHTNLMPAKDYGTNIIYLAGYPDEDSSIWGLSPEEVFKAYFKDLQKIAPVKLKDVKWRKVCSSRESVVVYKRGVMSKVRKMGNKTPIKNLVLCGAFNSYPEGSINESVKRGIECAELV
jgi:protoporphyrinogen oxidase